MTYQANVRQRAQKLMAQVKSHAAANREIGELAQALLEQPEHRQQVLSLLKSFEARLEAAGFQVCKEAQSPTGLQSPTTGAYAIWAWSKWSHPDCEVPFHVRLTLTVQASKPFLGEVSAIFQMADDTHTADGRGVLLGSPFRETVTLAERAGFVSSEGWQVHAQRGLHGLNLAALQGTFDLAMDHIEAVTTP
jgi:hypothetical protein